MSHRSPSKEDFMFRGNSPLQCLKYIDYLQKEDQEEDYINNVLNLMSSFETHDLLEIGNPNLIKKILQHCLNVSGALFLNNHTDNALELLEAARKLTSQFKHKDSTLETLKTLIYNNIAAYCLSIEDNSMAIKFLENCLKKDASMNSNLTCIFFNNLSSVYLTIGKYEKAFKYTKKSLYLIEPDIFSQVQEVPSKQLREDASFKKKLMILLIGYLNMGSILEGYQMRTSYENPNDEMLDMNPKDFFKNSYGLAKKYLGESHSLTHRLLYCYTKSDGVPFQKKIHDHEDSDVERYKSPKRRLESMLKSITNEDNVFTKKTINIRNRGSTSVNQSTKSISIPPSNNSFVRKSPSSRKTIHNPFKSATNFSDLSSPDGSYETPVEEHRKHARPMSGNMFHSYSPYLLPQQDPFYNSYNSFRFHRPSSGSSYRQDFYPQPAFPPTPDHTQSLLSEMLKQQKELTDKLNLRLEELKPMNTQTQFKSFGNVDSKRDNKEDSKVVSQLQEEIENLKQKMKQLIEDKEKKESSKTSISPTKGADSSSTLLQKQSSPATRTQVLSGNSPSSENSVPVRRESVLSTNSSGKNLHKFSAFQNTHIPIDNKSEKEPNEPNSTTLLGGLSPIPKADENSKSHGPLNSKEPDWIPGKYSDPNNRKFPLDLSKVGVFQGSEEAKRERGKDDTQGDGTTQGAAKDASQKNLNDMNKSGPKLVKQTDKVSVVIQPTKESATLGTVGSATSNSISTNALKSEEQPEKQIFNANGRRIPSASTAATKEQNDKDVSNVSIKIPGERDTSTRTQKGEHSEEEKPTRSDSDRSKTLTTGKRPSISIPTSIDYMDSPANKNNQITESKLPKNAIIKKRIFLEDNTQYMIVCTARWTKEEKMFKLQLMGIDEETGKENDKVESDLEVSYKDLRKILNHIEYKDIMPVTFHIKQIKNFYTLVRFLLIPFTTVRTLENGTKEIAIYPKPPNLLVNAQNDMPTIEFLGQQCVIIFTHVKGNIFRIVLTDPDNVEDAVRIDVEFDQTSFDLCFERVGGSDAELRSVQASNKIIAGCDDDADDDEVNDFRDVAKELSNPARSDEEELESFKVIYADLADELGNILKNMETFLVSYGVQKLSQYVDEKELKYSKLKINNKLKKTTLHFIWDKPEKQILDIKVQNFYETFAPETKIKACGLYNYLYDQVWKHFGVQYPQLDNMDKMGICSLVSEIFSLDVFEKEIPKDEFDRYEENPIVFVPMEIGCYQRIFLGEQYKFPLTLSLVGIRGDPKGIRATIYNLEDASEVGAFFHINSSVWAVPDKDRKKKSQRMAVLPLTEHYYLENILKKCGWDIIKDCLVLDKSTKRIDIVGIKVYKEIRTTEQFENVINPDTIFRHYGVKDEMDG